MIRIINVGRRFVAHVSGHVLDIGPGLNEFDLPEDVKELLLRFSNIREASSTVSPAVEESVVEESVDESIVEESVVEESVVEESVVEESVVEESVVEESVDESIVEESVVEESVVEESVDESIVEESIVEESIVEESSYSSMTTSQLRSLCRERGLDPGRLRKSGLIKLLEESE